MYKRKTGGEFVKKNQAYSELVCDYDIEKDINDEDLYSEQMIGSIKVEYLKIRSAEYEKLLKKRSGDYVSIHFDDICELSLEKESELVSVLAHQIQKFLKGKKATALVAGIGNPDFVADSVGKRSVQKLNVQEKTGICAVSVDVSEHTGIESSDIIRGIVSVTRPDVVVLIDSVLTKSGERLSRTIQLSNTGLSPGSALGAVKNPIDGEALGIPVITVGVPVMIDSHSMILSCFEELEMDEFERLEQYLKGKKRLFLTPHTIDFMIERFSYVIARAIEVAF